MLVVEESIGDQNPRMLKDVEAATATDRGI